MARDWLQLAKESYTSSTAYVDANYRKKWDDALRMFQSRHPSDSKYNTESYKHRSKIFRPKTRSLVRKHEAAIAAAVFSNLDVISTSPVNEDDPGQAASAAMMKEIIQYRLTKTIPWFQIVCGGMQDAMTMGVVCSYQYWKYKEKKGEKSYQPVVDEIGNPVIDDFGQIQYTTVQDKEIIEDEPCIELWPLENVRFDPGANWTDPIKTSPYLIRMIPMYVCDLKTQMENGDSETGKKWTKLSDGQIRSAMRQENDQTRQTREQNRQDSTDTGNAPITDFEIVWVHENFIRVDGDEVVYFTLGVEFMLTEPVPLKDVYFHNERPIVIGTCMIETHKSMPESPVMIAEQLQREANEIANQRIDNVKLVLNKRYLAKRGAQIDLKSIVRNVPGSVTLVNDPNGDIREISFPDVTGSSYQEQDRLNVDYDELTGNFSQGSVMTNRKMGETVGGMGMISAAANQVTEYTIRTFIETWMERVLRQLIKLEQKYETDEVILAIAASKAQLVQKYGINQVTDELLNKDLTLTVNVGMGATDPALKVQKFVGMLGAFANIAKMQLPNVNMEEVSKELFGLGGYRDGARFTSKKDDQPNIEELQMQLQQLQQQLQQAEAFIQQNAAEEKRLERESQTKIEQENIKSLAIERKAMIDAEARIESQNIQAELEVMLARIEAIKQQQASHKDNMTKVIVEDMGNKSAEKIAGIGASAQIATTVMGKDLAPEMVRVGI